MTTPRPLIDPAEVPTLDSDVASLVGFRPAPHFRLVGGIYTYLGEEPDHGFERNHEQKRNLRVPRRYIKSGKYSLRKQGPGGPRLH